MLNLSVNDDLDDIIEKPINRIKVGNLFIKFFIRFKFYKYFLNRV